ncbi:DNA-binding SARP family transcriptional activator [Saccharothrix tamanrassetensis]|uniref:DNA-binding SARP family transcriptional activator n=1 Tax=Saccharothrix tamanrassetensis TaxID=1051531 RepID=A0A841CMV2_9PSEU|nr:BTAD domain-containing putative transcriptional regulator [Saccharothrix tamanrassetensis]MBB5958253.1 DNA-binding SARP family transcriptional activator [Saccharothrix tamanrassetensis]
MTGPDPLPLVVELLGPVRVWRDGVEVDVGAARRRAVFAMLALRAGRTVSRSELIEGVWGDAPPATAEAGLYNHVSGLRQAFEPRRSRRSAAGVIVSTGGGYSLRIDHAGLDVHRFEQHRVRAQALAGTDVPGALAELERALALWRGDALSDVLGPFAESQRARLAELRLATVERRAELALAVGRGADVVAELSGLIAEHPVREGLHALLVTALHRSGRQAEALRAYRDAQRVLVDGMGIEPGPALRRAHREVLGGPARAARAQRTRSPEVAGIGFVGRHRELDLLRRAVTEVAAGRGGAVWLDGEPGVGKSAVLAAGLAGAGDAGCRVAWATGDELGGRLPLRVVLDALDGIAPHGRAAPADRVELATEWPEAVERLAEYVAEVCADGPLVLVVDGVQWADEASVRFWHGLLPLSARLPLLLVAAARPVPRRVDVARVRRAVVESGGEVVELDALPPADVAALVTALVGAPPGDGLRRLYGLAGGNPRYTRELVDAMLRDGRVEFRDDMAEVEADEDCEQVMPQTLVAALTKWLGFLSSEATGVLRWAALLGDEFAAADAATVAGRQVSELVMAVDEASAAGLLTDAGGRLAFRHPLLRRALYQAMPGAVRNALHREAARSLAEAGASTVAVARQLAAAPAAVDTWVADWLAEHEDELAEHAPELAARLLRAVVDQPSTDSARRERLAARLADLLFRLGRRPDAVAGFVLTRSRDPGQAAEMRWLLRYLEHADGDPAVLRAAVSDDEVPAVWRARLAALLSTPPHASGAGAEEMARLALRRAEDSGDAFAAAHAWWASWLACSARLAHEEALACADRGLAVVAGRADLRRWRTRLTADKAATLRHLDRFADADAVLRAGRAAVGASDTLHIAAAVQDYWLGRWDGTGADEPGRGYVLPLHGLGALVTARRGLVETARRHLDAGSGQPADDHRVADFGLVAEALLAEAAGQPDRAVAVVRPLLHVPRTASRHQWLPLLTRLALAAGRRDLAVRAAEVGAEDAALERVPAGASAAAAHCLGLVDGDPEPVLATANRYRDVGRPVELAEALEDAAALLAARGHDTDAWTALDEAVAGYHRLGAVLDVRRARTRLDRTRHGSTGLDRTGLDRTARQEDGTG